MNRYNDKSCHDPKRLTHWEALREPFETPLQRQIADAAYGRTEAAFEESMGLAPPLPPLTLLSTMERDPNNPFLFKEPRPRLANLRPEAILGVESAVSEPAPLISRSPSAGRATSSSFLTIAEYQRAYDAVMALNCKGLHFNQWVTISFGLMGLDDEAEVSKAYAGIMNDFGGWCRNRALPKYFIFVFERSVGKGLHCHRLMYIPTERRAKFRAAMNGWVDRRTTEPQSGVDGPSGKRLLIKSRTKHPETSQRFYFDYMMKGLDPAALVQAKDELGKRTRAPLSSLLKRVFRYQDPGVLAMSRLRVCEELSAASLKDIGFQSGLNLKRGIGLDTMWQVDTVRIDTVKVEARRARSNLAMIGRLEI